MPDHSVRSVTDLSAAFSHPLLLAGAFISLTGFKMQGEIVNTTQFMDNSKVVPLLNGSSITITNNNKAGTITFNACKLSGDVAKGDVTEIAAFLVGQADSQGGTLRLSFGLNGQTYAITFSAVTVKTVPPIKIAGDDEPDYAIEFNYATYARG